MTGTTTPERATTRVADAMHAPRPAASDAAVDDARALSLNLVLGALPPAEYAHLRTHLEPCVVTAGTLLADAARPLRHAYFPETGLLSGLRRMQDGTCIEAYAVGRDGLLGIPQLLGETCSSTCVAVGAVTGVCWRVALPTLRALLPELPMLAAMLPRMLVALLDQVQQVLACNTLHTVEQRCARRLLMTHDRVGDEFEQTHHMLAQLLAVRRAGVTVAAGAFQKAGLITYHRGRIRIVDRAGLEAAACECYPVMRAPAIDLSGVYEWTDGRAHTHN